ncbi:ABC transporter ATP-binding protein [Ktedonosporobacter rubrisoli]|uniref:ABC transporter ATP-binding protein n=1 Tax=Ktedonosporobacter rubrisoli TaxID=2509675 RepID=A0A4P6JJG4_KTERU|nr:ABC transporter ATP-binding protein [Ktedonosporobacter rubrisoli]QBD75267.1 ABC transporter ATP-binding protein [Ktedonosporobacter rubrisoli]
MHKSQGTQRQTNSRDGAALIQVEHISRMIDSRIQQTLILDDIAFTIPARTLFAITGPSGCGKSTLLNILTGIDRPNDGRVIFAGEPLLAKSENALARWRGTHIGIVFQFFQLLPTLTVLENVLLALELGGGGGLPRQHWLEHAYLCLETVGMQAYPNRLPGQLSGGQQQRVAIARALANNPPVLVADEPTGNLDSSSAQQIFKILASLTELGKTVIYVTHDPLLARQATAGIELIDGHIVNQRNANAAITSDRLRTEKLQ